MKKAMVTKQKIAACAVSAVLLSALGGCAPQTDETPVYTETLPNTGVQLTLANCTLTSTDDAPYVPARDSADEWVYYHTLRTADGAPLITLSGVTDDEVEIVFIEDIGELFVAYDRTGLQPLVDYVQTDLPDGVQYRMDTVYNYQFTVTTGQGTDVFFLSESREGLQ